MQKDRIIWKKINLPDCDYYMVSNLGQIKSIDRVDNLGRIRKGRIIKPSKCSNGYLFFSVFKNGKREIKRVHVCVANAFIKKNKNKIYVNHIDGLKTNNDVKNLEWVTPSQNQIHAYKIGLKKQPKGYNHSNSKINESILKEIKLMLKEGNTQQYIADKFKISQSTISKIKRKKTYINM